jgi:hypothetical protein
MIKQNKTKLHFILGAILVVTFAVTGCNNGKTNKNTDPVPPDSTMDSGNVRPRTDAKPL